MKKTRIIRWLRKTFMYMLPRRNVPSIQNLARRFEEELADRTFIYSFNEVDANGKRNGKSFSAPVEFERSGFCHLFSIGSIVKNQLSDLSEFSGIRGWNNIQNGKITFAKLAKSCPEEFQYYKHEYEMIEQMIETAKNPQAVLFDPSKAGSTKLQAKVILYRIYGDETVHIGLDEGKDGWFVRSYFIRSNDRDRAYPTKYIAKMTPLDVKVRVKY